MKKGFTLVEVLTVIILLGIIFILAMPPILNSINKAKINLNETSEKLLYGAADLYVSDNLNIFPRKSENTYCITIKKLKEVGNLPTDVYAKNGKLISETNLIKVKFDNDKFHYNIDNSCKEFIKEDDKPKPNPEPDPELPSDKNQPNVPHLLSNMIPIHYDGTNWKYADINSKWYDYDNKEWANAVVLNKNITKNPGDVISESEIDLWYVWIPRYKYQMFNVNGEKKEEQIINVVFESKLESTGTMYCEDKISKVVDKPSEICYKKNGNVIDKSKEYIPSLDDYYTHPAFMFGDKALSGIWVGKFELSGANVKNMKIRPGLSSITEENVESYSTNIKKFIDIYGIVGDSHMMKNMEWGAVAYLSQSEYGKGLINISSNDSYEIGGYYYTGGGLKLAYKKNGNQSTTNNIYGIYDMSGGTFEYLMSLVANEKGNADLSGKTLDKKYYDLYSYNENNSKIGKYGDATKETKYWYGDEYDYPYYGVISYPWFVRGGTVNDGLKSGLFNFNYWNGGYQPDCTTRAVLVE